MAITVKIPHSHSSSSKGKATRPHRSDPVIKTAVASFIVLASVFFAVFAYFYLKYERVIDQRMNGPIFSNSARIYARPKTLHVGQTISASEMIHELRRAGYSEMGGESESRIGTYRVVGDAVEIHPGAESYHTPEVAVVRFAGGKVAHIGAAGGGQISAYELEPQLVTALFNEERAKRQIVHFNEIPKVLVDAVLAIEDRRFFQHSGINYWRTALAVWDDLRSGGRGRGPGASTITMQAARNLHIGGLTAKKTHTRKAAEMLIALQLEQKLNKQQIFELYANQVPMGQRGSFSINGFAEAARSYFNKDLQSITLPEAALLAGIIQGPSRLSPYRHPEAAVERRNVVLESMVETGTITREQADQAKAAPLKLAPPNVEASDAPYFVDMVKDQLASHYTERDLNDQAYRIYTTLDPDLQRAAAEAVQEGMKGVDALVQKRKAGATTGTSAPLPQVAMVVLDPHTGDVLALVGGRNYAFSQLNHVVAKRPTGSIFKPFVFAAAMNSALDGSENPQTPISMIDDAPTTFSYGGQTYQPRNYKNEYHGQVTARYALAMSLNNATVKLAEQVGFDRIADLARSSGISGVRPTPAMALGAYDATPLEMAGAYTVFANQGVRMAPAMVRSVRSSQGEVIEDYQTNSKSVMDPRVAYVMTSMMEGVVNYGMGYEVRRRGFTAPAAGKTGTSHDAWFAGYTSNLLCIVWVGNDDYTDLRISGALAAAPIWAEFMKRATRLPEYRDMQGFAQPSGVVDVQVDKLTNLLSTPACPESINVAFIAGTEPTLTCEQAGEQQNLMQGIVGAGPSPSLPGVPQPGVPVTPKGPNGQVQPAQEQKKKGFFGKIVGIFSDDGQQQQPPK